MPTVIDILDGSIEGGRELVNSGQTTYTRFRRKLIYVVLGDSTADTPSTIETATGVPLPGVGSYAGALCTRTTPKELTIVRHPGTGVNVGLWHVDAEFDTDARPTSDTTPEVFWTGETDKELFDQDAVDGRKIVTAAGEPIFAEKPFVVPTLNIKRYEDYPFNPNTILLFCNRVNSTLFYGAPRGTVLLLPIEADEERQDPSTKKVMAHYKLKFLLKTDAFGNLLEDTWKYRPLNQGYLYRKAPGEKPITKVDKLGHPIKVNLKLDGTELVNLEGTNLEVVDLFQGFFRIRDYTLYPGPTVIPPIDVIGSLLEITGGASWQTGYYRVVDARNYGPSDILWTVKPASEAGLFGPASVGVTGGLWTLHYAPIYLEFNRHFYANHNALDLGPFA